MARNSGIEWTDHTWNPWQGCTKISPGCKFCYMYRDKARYGQDATKVVRSAPATFDAPMKWEEAARVFACSWSDFFIEQADAWRDEAWNIIRRTPHLTYQILTKRPERIAGHLPADWGQGYPNVWLGVSAENQEYAERRIPLLLQIPAAIRFVSYEPALGPLDFTRVSIRMHLRESLAKYLGWDGKSKQEAEREAEENTTGGEEPFANSLTGAWFDGWDSGSDGNRLNWVIAGGETGRPSEVRPTDNQWLRSVRDQCKAAGVPFFLKQITSDGHPIPFDRWPEDLKVREFPA